MFRFILVVALLLPNFALADRVTDKKIADLDIANTDSSIYNLHFWTDTSIILSGFAISLTANALAYSLIYNRGPSDPNAINFLDRPVAANQSKAFDIGANYTLAAAMAAPIIIDYLDVGYSKAFAEDMLIYSEVLSVTFGLVTIAKFSVQRPYPYVYQYSPSSFNFDPTDYLSFYSGHTATTVAALSSAAVTLNLRHRKVLWPWILTAAMGTGVGLELILSGEHFTSDVIVGAAMGLAVGTVVPGLHARDRDWFDHIRLVTSHEQAEVFYSFNL